jgi:hypothetical protein
MTPLNNKQHANFKVQKINDVTRFKEQHLIPITVHDFIPLAAEFPIIFVKNEETGQFTSVAMMGIRPGVNLYCQEKEWSCHVSPLGFSNAPFTLVKTTEDNNEVIVCFDENSPLINTEKGESLFNESGDKTEYLAEKTTALINMAEFTEQTKAITGLFAQKKLFVSKSLSVKLSSQNEPLLLNGLYMVDEKILNNLSTEEFEYLRNKGLLPLIYAHLASLKQVNRLTIKQNALDLIND